MKKFLAILLSACFLLSACASELTQTAFSDDKKSDSSFSSSEDLSVETTAESMTSSPELPDTVFPSTERAVGIEQTLITNDRQLYSRFLYPAFEITWLDTLIEDWAEATYKNYVEENRSSRRTNTKNASTLTVGYNSYKASDNYISVEEDIYYNSDLLEKPKEEIKLFNIDLVGERLLKNSEILDYQKLDQLYPILHSRLISQLPELALSEISVDFFDHILLTEDGVSVLLPGIDGLQSEYDIVRVTLTYKELGDILLLEIDKTPEDAPSEHFDPTPLSTDPYIRELDPNLPMIALTFDDGPSAYTEDILNTLNQYGAKGTFFVVGNITELHPDVMQKIVLSGSEIGNHSWNHKDLSQLQPEDVRNQILQTNATVEKLTGFTPTALRPPYGKSDGSVKGIAAETGMSIALWSIDTVDWKNRDSIKVFDHIKSHAFDGGVVICHDLYGSTADAMKMAVPYLVENGYQLVTFSELLYYRHPGEDANGKVYREGKPLN